MKKKLTEKEQRQRLTKAAKSVADAEAALASPDDREVYLQFMARYSLCELGYKSILADHIKDSGKKPSANLTIEYKQVPAVLKRVGLEIDEKTVEEVFSATRKIGERHARGLRNSLSHSPNSAAINELRQKQNEINTAMDTFLSALRNGAMDNSAKGGQA